LYFDKANLLKIKAISCVFYRKYSFHDASGHDDLIFLELLTSGSQLRRQPRNGIVGMPEDVAAVPFANRNTVFRCTSENTLQIWLFRRKL
jgi:hypothetical protein